MSTQAMLTISTVDGRVLTVQECRQFSLLRERYQPYSLLHAVFLCDDTDYRGAYRIQFSLNGAALHDGILRKMQVQECKNQKELHIESHGFSEVLLHNQLVPGLYPNITLTDLMTQYALPHLTYESGVTATNYIYVKDNTAMWDALSAYNYKLNGNVPYVTVCNHLRVTGKEGADSIILPQDVLTDHVIIGDTNAMISRIDMADIDGTYGTYTMSNAEATAREIVRVKQILMDKQFLYDPMDALAYRLSLSNRRMVQERVTYLGYCGEDLEDMVECESVMAGHVSRILVVGDGSGVRTTDTLYYDDFCNATQQMQ